MSHSSRRFGTALILLCLAARTALAGDFFETDGLALRGYDPVAYFETGSPVRGDQAFHFDYRGSKFVFASADHRARFAADPEKYAPQFGGYCALGTANGYKVATQPDAFQVVDGKLYLNYDRKVREIWRKDVPGNIARADHNWPEVQKQPIRE